MINGHSHLNGYTHQQQQNSVWPYKQAKHYDDWQSIIQAFPHLKNVNNHVDFLKQKIVNGMVIRSGNDDNIHKAIKYGIWTTTPRNKGRIEQLWNKTQQYGTDAYLFFSVVRSGMFEGVARLTSGFNEETFPFWWENETLKFKGHFKLEWIYIKDINNKHFTGLINRVEEEVTKSKDCDYIDTATVTRMLQTFDKRKTKRSMFQDFAFMDQRQLQYIRKMNEQTKIANYYNEYKMYAMNNFQVNLVGHPLNFMSSINLNNPINQLMSIPPILKRPNASNLNGGVGFHTYYSDKSKQK